MPPPTAIDQLLTIMARLRDPDGGCPWDLRQTFRTIVPYTLEEAYEVAETIEEGDMQELKDELGDLLFQVVFYAQMAKEQGAFDFAEVVQAICEKMIRRHPHVFDHARVADEGELRAAWERQKHQERERKRGTPGDSLLDGIAKTLPALVRAEKLQRRAARVGFDWDQISGVFAKVEEELGECRELLQGEGDPARLQHEVGDLLFACANLARHLGVDGEQALRAANHRFEQRFHFIEQGLLGQGKEASAEHREEMERLWEASKRREP